MRRKALLAAAAFVVTIVGFSLAVALSVGRELAAAGELLSGSPQGATAGQIARSRDHLANAIGDLNGWPSKILGILPVAGHNLDALEAMSRRGKSVLDIAFELRTELDTLEAGGLIADGVVDIDAITALTDPLSRMSRAVAGLELAASEHLGGALLPPVWDRLHELRIRSQILRRDTELAAELTALAPSLLGGDAPRTYVVVLLNNSELRGTGGIPSGVGTLEIEGGRVELGAFEYYGALAARSPDRRVAAPADFRRRYGRFEADTPLWLNTTLSPDASDVAIVAARLYRLATGIESEGVIFVDPRGLAALLAPGSMVEVPGTDIALSRRGLPYFVHAGAYARFEAQEARREALVGVGKRVFREMLAGDFGAASTLKSLGAAVAGRHIRFVSFDHAVSTVLDEIDITGRLRPPEGDGLLVTVQNLGADKLDYWVHRDVRHLCVLADNSAARCESSVMLTNKAPRGLPPYVVQDRASALAKSFLEIYIPSAATVEGVDLDGQPTDVILEEQDGYESIGVEVELARGHRTMLRVVYELLPSTGYSLRAIPQPLGRDASLHVELTVPETWTIRGPGLIANGRLVYEGAFTQVVKVEAAPEDKKAGISGLWDSLVSFWQQPVF